MFYMDYLGSMHQMNVAAHGYASYFALSIMDRYWVSSSRGEGSAMIDLRCSGANARWFACRVLGACCSLLACSY